MGLNYNKSKALEQDVHYCVQLYYMEPVAARPLTCGTNLSKVEILHGNYFYSQFDHRQQTPEYCHHEKTCKPLERKNGNQLQTVADTSGWDAAPPAPIA